MKWVWFIIIVSFQKYNLLRLVSSNRNPNKKKTLFSAVLYCCWVYSFHLTAEIIPLTVSTSLVPFNPYFMSTLIFWFHNIVLLECGWFTLHKGNVLNDKFQSKQASCYTGCCVISVCVMAKVKCLEYNCIPSSSRTFSLLPRFIFSFLKLFLKSLRRSGLVSLVPWISLLVVLQKWGLEQFQMKPDVLILKPEPKPSLWHTVHFIAQNATAEHAQGLSTLLLERAFACIV